VNPAPAIPVSANLTDASASAARLPVLGSYCPGDDAASGGAITTFLQDVADEYQATFAESIEFITERVPPSWGQRDPWQEALDAGAPLVAMITPAFTADSERATEAMGLTGPEAEDPTGRAVLLPWERLDEPGGEAIPTIGEIAPDSELSAEAVRGVAYWIRGVVETLTEHRPAETELTAEDTRPWTEHPLGRELAFEARQYSRLSAQILHNARILDQVSVAIFEGFEEVLGSDWHQYRAEGTCDLAVALSPRVAESRIGTRTMLRAWKEGLRILRHMHETCVAADYYPFREHVKAMLWDLADALDIHIDLETLSEIQCGADHGGELQPAFKALLRNARARQKVRGGALSMLAAVGEPVPEPDEFWDPDILNPRPRHNHHRKKHRNHHH
jgi:hypothetical protein